MTATRGAIADGDAPSGDAAASDGAPLDGTPEEGSAATDAYAATVLADGPIAYFRFSDANGSTCKNEIAGG